MPTETTTKTGNTFTRFMASGYGRMARLGLGATLVAGGLTVMPRPAGLIVAAFGLVPLAAGAFNLCPVAPLWGGHFFGSQYCAPKKGQGSG